MRWDDVKIFLAAYQAGSCAAAARDLGLSQSTVSRRLSALEEALGGPLFVRAAEGLQPLPVADRLHDAASTVKAGMDDLRTVFGEAERSAKGLVRVALPDMVASEVLAAKLPSLLERNRGLIVEFVTGEQVLDLVRDQIDLALRLVRPTTGDLTIRRVATLGFSVYGHRAYLERHRGTPSHELAWVDWGGEQRDFPGSAWLRMHMPEVKPVFRTTNLAARLRVLCAGFGVGVVADALAARRPMLERLPGLPPLPERALWLVGHRGRAHVPRIRAVRDYILECVRELAAEDET